MEFAVGTPDVTKPFPVPRNAWDRNYWPVLAVPIGMAGNGTPLSLSISGAPWQEALVLRAGNALQRRSDHHLPRPPLDDGCPPSAEDGSI